MMDSYTPKYVVVQNYILEKIESGVLGPGDKIPSENELARMFGLSRVTVNAALSQLATQGVVDRIKGKGTFVKKLERFFNGVDSRLQSFKISSKRHDDDHKLVKTEVLTAGSGEKVKLLLLPGERYHRITRLMCAEDKVIAVDYSYLPYSAFPREMDERAIEENYLHVFIREHCHKEPKRLYTYIDIITFPDEVQQKYLKARSDEPLLLWNTMVIDADDMILGYTATCARPGDFQPYLNFLL